MLQWTVQSQLNFVEKFRHRLLNFSIPNLQRCVEIAVEKSSSPRLSAISVDSHGFYLIRESLEMLRYGWALPSVPGKCHCGKPFLVDSVGNNALLM